MQALEESNNTRELYQRIKKRNNKSRIQSNKKLLLREKIFLFIPSSRSVLSNAWPALRLKLLKNYIAELNVLFSLICWSSLEPLNVYTYVYNFLL